MMEKLSADDFRMNAAIEMIVLSPQFREIRGERE
jgi:hypothetical protein